MSTGATKPSQFRLGEQTLEQIDQLAADPAFAGNRSAVIRTAINDLFQRKAVIRKLSERPATTPKKSRKKSV